MSGMSSPNVAIRAATLESPSTRTRPARPLGKYRKIIIAAALFLLLDLGVLALNFYNAYRTTQDAVAINLAGRQRYLSQSVARALLELNAMRAAGVPYKPETLAELHAAAHTFHISNTAFRDGGTIPGGDGKPVYVDPILSSRRHELETKVDVLWKPYYALLQPLLSSDGFTRQELAAALAYSQANNIKLLDAANDFVTEMQLVGAARSSMLPIVQTGGFVLALLNLAFIFKLLRRLNTSDAALEAALEDARLSMARLEYANKELEAFSYSVSHDLRTPLIAIEGFSGLLEKALAAPASPKTSERSQHLIKRIRVGVGQMGELIDALLSLAHVSRTRLRWEPVNLSALVQEVLDGYLERHPERAVQLDIEPELMACGDPRLLQQVFENLLGNAWKFSAGQPLTQIAFGQETGDGGERVYFIRDNGAGFDMAYADKLFETFQRLHTPSEFAGSGIGLATVHRIVVRHGGRIWARSAPQQGATFYFTLDEVKTAPLLAGTETLRSESLTSKYLEIQHVEQTFQTKKGPFYALKNINLTVARGEFVTLIGHSGCGKSTLLNLIAGLTTPTQGVLLCANREIAGPGPERAVVFQNHSLLPWLSCFENVYLAVERVFAATESKAQLKARTDAALAMVGLGPAAQKRPGEISGGMKQRVGIARALCMEPKVLLLDEPFGALDALTRAKLQDELLQIVATTQSTVVMVTHDVDEAVLLSDRIVMMTNGPSATIGEVLQVDLPRPRSRVALAEDSRYLGYRKAVIDFLYTRQGQVEKAACPARSTPPRNPKGNSPWPQYCP